MKQDISGDRELLELAAKAAGYRLEHSISAMYPYADVFRVESERWNPLADDGDALRLAVILKLLIDHYYNGCAAVGSAELACEDFMQPLGDDPYAATRRAIVRAAAEIGRKMEGGTA